MPADSEDPLVKMVLDGYGTLKDLSTILPGTGTQGFLLWEWPVGPFTVLGSRQTVMTMLVEPKASGRAAQLGKCFLLLSFSKLDVE